MAMLVIGAIVVTFISKSESATEYRKLNIALTVLNGGVFVLFIFGYYEQLISITESMPI